MKNIKTSYAIDFRDAKIEDAGLMLTWRNHPAVRKVSFSSDEIKLEDHLSWLRNALASDTKIILFATIEEKEVGTLRLDLDGCIAMISIYLDPNKLGQGIGTAILNALKTWVEENLTHIAFLQAEIIPGNTPSEKLFRSAGFDFKETCFEYIL